MLGFILEGIEKGSPLCLVSISLQLTIEEYFVLIAGFHGRKKRHSVILEALGLIFFKH